MSTIIARICEKWIMDLEQPEGDHDEWFLDWVLRSPRQAGIHLTAGLCAYQAVREAYGPKGIRTVREYFGGMGAQSLMIEDLFQPSYHAVYDYSFEATQHLKRVLSAEVIVEQRDSYEKPMFRDSQDLVGLDFGDLTAWKVFVSTRHPHRALLDNVVFSAEPRAVVLTDIACRYLHLNRDKYEEALGAGTCDTYEDYLAAFAAKLESVYGYRLLAGFSHRWSTVMALVPQDLLENPGVIVPTPDRPVGLELF